MTKPSAPESETIFAGERIRRLREQIAKDAVVARRLAIDSARSRVLELIAAGESVHAVLETLAVITEELSVGLPCSILLLNADKDRLVLGAAPSFTDDDPLPADGVPIGPDASTCGLAAFRRERVVVQDLEDVPPSGGCHELNTPHGIRACWCQPILDDQGDPVGTLAMHCMESRGPTAFESELLDSASDIASLAIHCFDVKRAAAESEERYRTEHEAFEKELANKAHELEGQVERRTRRLARSESRYRQLYDFAPDLYVTLDPDGRFTDINQTALEVLGYTRDEALGKHVGNWLAPNDREGLPEWLSALEHGRSVNNEDCTLLKKNGQALRTIINATVRRNTDGTIEEFWITLRDISRRVALHRRLEESEKFAMTGRLAAGVAHEINNPLQAMLMHMSLVEEALPEAFAERESWEIMSDSVHRIRDVVGSLLDLHRVGRSRLDVVDLNELVHDAVGLLETQLQVNRIRLDLQCAPDLPRLRLIPQHMYQIVLNLVLNASEAMKDGGVLGVRTRIRSGHVVLEVSDTGPGMPTEKIEDLFDPLFSTRRHGTGLGLFVTSSLVKEQGGEITIRSGKGKKTLVRVILPYAAPDNDELSPGQPACA